ncbi:MAG: glycosyltransferase [Candidatus Woesearchaeota archaeon]
MRIAYIAHPLAFQLYGGSELQFERYYQLLKKHFKIKIFNPTRDDLSTFQVLHNFTLNPDMLPVLEYAKKLGIKIVTNSNYWNLEKIVLNNPEFSIFKRIGYVLSSKLTISGRFNWLLKFFNPKLVYIYGQKLVLDLSDTIIVNSQAEKYLLVKDFKICKSKIFVIPNGVDQKFRYGSASAFIKKYRIKDFVLYVGRIEPKKNVLSLIRATRNINTPLVIVGDYNPNYPKYCAAVKKEAEASNTVIIPRLPHDSEMLRSAYKACKVFALVSFGETPGLSALEAGLAGANVVITEIGSTREYFSDFAYYVNPESQIDIENKIKKAYETQKNRALSKHIYKNYLWKKILTKTKFEEVYCND